MTILILLFVVLLYASLSSKYLATVGFGTDTGTNVDHIQVKRQCKNPPAIPC